MLEKLSVWFGVVESIMVRIVESLTMHRIASNRINQGTERTIMSS